MRKNMSVVHSSSHIAAYCLELCVSCTELIVEVVVYGVMCMSILKWLHAHIHVQ